MLSRFHHSAQNNWIYHLPIRYYMRKHTLPVSTPESSKQTFMTPAKESLPLVRRESTPASLFMLLKQQLALRLNIGWSQASVYLISFPQRATTNQTTPLQLFFGLGNMQTPPNRSGESAESKGRKNAEEDRSQQFSDHLLLLRSSADSEQHHREGGTAPPQPA